MKLQKDKRKMMHICLHVAKVREIKLVTNSMLFI